MLYYNVVMDQCAILVLISIYLFMTYIVRHVDDFALKKPNIITAMRMPIQILPRQSSEPSGPQRRGYSDTASRVHPPFRRTSPITLSSARLRYISWTHTPCYYQADSINISYTKLYNRTMKACRYFIWIDYYSMPVLFPEPLSLFHTSYRRLTWRGDEALHQSY